jgi:5'-methylthioadenosine phosphorylase
VAKKALQLLRTGTAHSTDRALTGIPIENHTFIPELSLIGKVQISMLGIIGGTSLLFSDLPRLEKRVMHNPFGSSEVWCGEIALLQRHQGDRPPHRINFRSHLASLALLGVDRVVTIGSAGSLKEEIPPGSLLIPSDYLSTTDIPSIHENRIRHVHPGFTAGLTQELADTLPEARFGGVYAQTRGPRIETVSEVRALAAVADVVGMTIASEATLAVEFGMAVCALCTIDNYANGLSGESLTYEHILACAEEHKERTGEMVTRIIGRMA